MRDEAVRRLAALFLCVEAVATAGLWVAIAASPDGRPPVEIALPTHALLAYLPADLVFWIGLPVAVAAGLLRRRAWAWPLLVAHAGVAVFTTLYAFGLAATSGTGWPGALAMTPSLALAPWFAWMLRPRPPVPCAEEPTRDV